MVKTDPNSVDILKELHKLQESLPPNSIKFNLSVSNLKMGSRNETPLEFIGKGTYLNYIFA